MQNRFSFFLIITLMLITSTISNAQIGSIDEAIRAAVNRKEPAYLETMISDVHRRFNRHRERLSVPCALNPEKSVWPSLLEIESGG